MVEHPVPHHEHSRDDDIGKQPGSKEHFHEDENIFHDVPQARAATVSARVFSHSGKKRVNRIFCYLSIRINSSFDIPFQMETLEMISFNVPMAISSCRGIVIVCSPAGVVHLSCA